MSTAARREVVKPPPVECADAAGCSRLSEFDDIRRTQAETQVLIDNLKACHAGLRASIDGSMASVQVLIDFCSISFRDGGKPPPEKK